jgi:hypothetical protein
MNSSLNIILSILSIGIAKSLQKGSGNIGVETTKQIAKKISQAVKISDVDDSLKFITTCLEDMKEEGSSLQYHNFIQNLSWMRNAPYNEPYYVSFTQNEFTKVMIDYFNLFSSWHSLPFLELHSSSTRGVTIKDILATETAKNKLHQFRDLMYKNHYTYLSAYYSLKQLPFVPNELKPYQILFAKAFLSINESRFKNSVFDKNENFIESLGFFESEPMMQRTKISIEERSLSKTMTPSQLSIFDDDFNSVITRIRSSVAIKKKTYISNTLKKDFSSLSLPNVMPPKELLILFWSYKGELQVKSDVTHLWKERQHE